MSPLGDSPWPGRAFPEGTPVARIHDVPQASFTAPPQRKSSNKGCLWAALIVAGLGVVTVLALAGGAYYWFESNKNDLRNMGLEADQRGRAFGRAKVASDCINEGLRQTDECGELDIMCQVKPRLFTKACLDSTDVPTDFCNDVPPTNDIMDSVFFRNARCHDLGRPNSQSCQRFLEVLQNHCHPKA